MGYVMPPPIVRKPEHYSTCMPIKSMPSTCGPIAFPWEDYYPKEENIIDEGITLEPFEVQPLTKYIYKEF